MIKGAEAVTAQGELIKFDFAGGTMRVGWRGSIHACGSQLSPHDGRLIRFLAAGSGSAVGGVKSRGCFWEWPLTVEYMP
ncbi:MAG: hypothetical protein QXT81_03300 [Candidatus Bathyarchaeia archaeon]